MTDVTRHYLTKLYRSVFALPTPPHLFTTHSTWWLLILRLVHKKARLSHTHLRQDALWLVIGRQLLCCYNSRGCQGGGGGMASLQTNEACRSDIPAAQQKI